MTHKTQSEIRLGADFGERKVLADVAEYGWHCMNVLEDDGHPPWSFTIGLYETWRHPELIIIGRSRTTAHHVLDRIAAALDDNHRVDLSQPASDLIPGSTCFLLEVAAQHYHDYVGYARWFYRDKQFPHYQIVWPSNDGHYPWGPNAPKSFKEWQPVLGKVPTNAH